MNIRWHHITYFEDLIWRASREWEGNVNDGADTYKWFVHIYLLRRNMINNLSGPP